MGPGAVGGEDAGGEIAMNGVPFLEEVAGRGYPIREGGAVTDFVRNRVIELGYKRRAVVAQDSHMGQRCTKWRACGTLRIGSRGGRHARNGGWRVRGMDVCDGMGRARGLNRHGPTDENDGTTRGVGRRADVRMPHRDRQRAGAGGIREASA